MPESNRRRRFGYDPCGHKDLSPTPEHAFWCDFRPDLPLARKPREFFDPAEHHDGKPCPACRSIVENERRS